MERELLSWENPTFLVLENSQGKLGQKKKKKQH